MDPEAFRNARESLELDFQTTNILETGLDRHTLSVLAAFCEKGLQSRVAALVKELRRESQTNPTTTPAAPTFP
ncbi:hypothetical protein MKW98_019020 [Papaver atlanticum]|uniref:Mitotic-spindle organizing protein 1 n=1 Tax=Papaver atlanticum TaxID=357466 RepID=A0AAD4XXZ8_9MAGN|nr:hypothetical protein MKW98_019020 [Papaver atlanticum]